MRVQEGFLCPDCHYAAISPEDLLRHVSVMHAASASYHGDGYGGGGRGSDTQISSGARRPADPPTRSSWQELQLQRNDAVYTLVLLAHRAGLPEEVTRAIWHLAAPDAAVALLRYAALRLPADYARMAPFWCRTARAQGMLSWEPRPITRSLVDLGRHPVARGSAVMVDLSRDATVDALARTASLALLQYCGDASPSPAAPTTPSRTTKIDLPALLQMRNCLPVNGVSCCAPK